MQVWLPFRVSKQKDDKSGIKETELNNIAGVSIFSAVTLRNV